MAERTVEKIRFGICPSLRRLKTDRDYDDSAVLATSVRSVVIVELETHPGDARTQIPKDTGATACAIRTLNGEWVYFDFEDAGDDIKQVGALLRPTPHR